MVGGRRHRRDGVSLRRATGGGRRSGARGGGGQPGAEWRASGGE